MGELLTTAEAAHRLGVKVATLYAYVSRGQLLSHAATDGRGSRFDAAEVDALAGRGRSGRRPVGAVETVRSALTSIDGDRLRYRGHDAVELSRGHSFEAVARLLWSGTATPGPFAGDAELSRQARVVLDALPAGCRLPDRLRVAVSVVGALGGAPGGALSSPEVVLGSVLGALAPGPSVGEGLAAAAGAPGVRLDAPLVLLADHGLAVSTVAARVAASARAPLTSVLSAALGAADGPLHAGAASGAHRFLADAVGGSLVVEPGVRPPGFGHVVHATSDPRAEELLATVLTAWRTSPVAEVLPTVLERVVRVHGADAFPNVDLGLAAFTHAHGLAGEVGELLFEVARCAGWMAHALEEYAAPALRFRVRGLHGE